MCSSQLPIIDIKKFIQQNLYKKKSSSNHKFNSDKSIKSGELLIELLDQALTFLSIGEGPSKYIAHNIPKVEKHPSDNGHECARSA